MRISLLPKWMLVYKECFVPKKLGIARRLQWRIPDSEVGACERVQKAFPPPLRLSKSQWSSIVLGTNSKNDNINNTRKTNAIKLFHYPQEGEIKMKVFTLLSLCISFTLGKRRQGRPSFIICSFSALLHVKSAVHGGAVGWGNALQRWRSLIRFPVGIFGCSIVLILPAALWQWGRLRL